MAVVGGRPRIKGSCGERRGRLKYLTEDRLRCRFWSPSASSAHFQVASVVMFLQYEVVCPHGDISLSHSLNVC